MTAKAQQVLLNLSDCTMKIECAHRTTATSPHAILETDHDGRHAELVRDARRYDAKYAAMPAPARSDDRALRRSAIELPNLFEGGFRDLLLQSLAFIVECFDTGSQTARFISGLCTKQT